MTSTAAVRVPLTVILGAQRPVLVGFVGWSTDVTVE